MGAPQAAFIRLPSSARQPASIRHIHAQPAAAGRVMSTPSAAAIQPGLAVYTQRVAEWPQ